MVVLTHPLANRVIRAKLENHRDALLDLKKAINKLLPIISGNRRDIVSIVPAINRHERAITLLQRLITTLNDDAAELSRDNVGQRLWRLPGGTRRGRLKRRRKTRKKRINTFF